MKNLILRAVAYIAAAFLISTAVAMGASAVASSSNDAPCVPKDAYTETVNHPAETHVVHHEAVTHVVHHEAVPATPDLWWNWSPNKHQGPFEGPPSFPTDSRGTWQGPHKNGGPDQDTYGTFNSSHGASGRASWFHREHGTAEVPAYDETVVDHPAYDETVVDHEAWVETINHPAVTCPTVPTEPTPPTPPTVVTVVPTTPSSTAPHHTAKPVTPTVVHAGLGSLPNTGGPNWELGGVAALMLMAGVGLVVLGKRVRA